MKNNLVIKKYATEKVKGVRTAKETRTFFGSKLIDVEDEIYVNNIAIQYSEVVDKVNISNDHYQNYTENPMQPETVILKSLDDVKFENHSIDAYSQKEPSPNVANQNYEWILVIDAKNILKEYLFLRLKESRIFKTIRSEDLIERNVNTYIYNYIENNLLNRFNISELSFYVQYFDVIQNSTVFSSYRGVPNNQVILSPTYNKNIFSPVNKVPNVNIITPDYLVNLDKVKIIYNQIKNIYRYKYDYYFTIRYKKI